MTKRKTKPAPKLRVDNLKCQYPVKVFDLYRVFICVALFLLSLVADMGVKIRLRFCLLAGTSGCLKARGRAVVV